ncbi:hypothetical protein EMQ25_02195 [Arsenicitalea aurantiaca]|uniref:Uncharacterized protein n=1 Tax=Arsenicitalea aurantiaca TaxID=1783274 RepID=A0A433XL57_9HYPH|nr:hypothetical protein [Arsenicitalea aurantiaca]RUT34791.1 hypothetical protein EMQ25_02195 [Arsenicitalea aurantiaca]
MVRESTSAIVGRNEIWRSDFATEPYEAGWAGELVLFVRALEAGGADGVEARVQISPDGMHWVDEGTRLTLPSRKDAIGYARIAHFGNWVRLVGTLPDGAALKIIVTIHAKA